MLDFDVQSLFWLNAVLYWVVGINRKFEFLFWTLDLLISYALFGSLDPAVSLRYSIFEFFSLIVFCDNVDDLHEFWLFLDGTCEKSRSPDFASATLSYLTI